MLAALLIFLFVAVPADVTLQPDPPIAGRQVRILAEPDGATIHLASPFGNWSLESELAGGGCSVDLPGDLPVLLAGKRLGEEVEFSHQAWLVRGVDGRLVPRAQFWWAYLNAGFPSPFPLPGTDDAAALEAIEAGAESAVDDPVVKELLWRLRGRAAGDKEEYLRQLDAEIAQAPSGRLVLAAARVHHQLGDAAGSAALAQRYKDRLLEVEHIETERWAGIVGMRNPRERIAALHRWLEEDPFNDYMPSILQILAASYSESEDYRSTALFGLLSLRVTPDDAMTLNGVAFAMAEGGFERERGLELASQAISILQNPERLNKPPQLSERRWREELEHALAACLDTKGWLLTGLGRYEEARSAFQAALEIEREDIFYLHLGLMLIERGDREGAVNMLRKGARLGGPNRLRIESELDRLGK
ncbi:MAG TPA: tetratricopeptide repeat protein [Acidobacteriota bacterium]|nr:tetratricopeptide repeat protein [Acidobacteriota bacterium]